MDVVIRDDDINANTDFEKLAVKYALIRDLVPDVKIWSSVSMFSRENEWGSVYPEPPFKNKKMEWFYSTDQFYIPEKITSTIISHGLYHVDHSQLSYDAQKMSILGSCNFLRSYVFCPPFNRFNDQTIKICDDSGIYLTTKDDWKSFEFENFNINHRLWYFHSWRFSIEKLRDVIKHSTNLGQLQRNAFQGS